MEFHWNDTYNFIENDNYMHRAYGSHGLSLRLFPWIKIHGYNIDRAYGSFKYNYLITNALNIIKINYTVA